METKNNVLIVALLTLVLGFGVGYFIGTGRTANPVQAVSSDMHGAMEGMTSGIAGKTGDALDQAFLDEMITHHEGAIVMAETLLRETKRPELVKLANDIITAQTQEIRMMEEWRTAWFEHQ
ncbi:MAG: hypothetical protein A2494_03195 [Candidatus Lloydbacteria bacterium RIFOXYC12_FULL_46_25]|uniref:DUF305 domain-containing protein n=1 Tax=Candidatus Lloydbacteria bacterium RIFOXYC12_FULL_46_25 TaxID=1798670 RepID=A0A1G2DUG6_9BACT|nr:MAG: hypothetical protein A2494_03195 [Candidatus Lloydbacteria bacterium RIFOXYC12_FULL_46_25]